MSAAMKLGAPKPTRDNDSLCTPEWVLDLVRRVGRIDLDPCSNEHSTVGARTEWALHRGDDGLAGRWAPFAEGGLIFVNCPYSHPTPWVMRAIEAASDGAEVLMLLKHDPSTKWSARLRGSMDARCDFHRRISFEGGAHKSGMMASTMVYMGPNPFLFAHVFEGVGEVRVYR